MLDEAQELGEDALAALLPTISASSNPQTIFTGTPPGPNADGAIFSRVRKDGLAGGDPRLCWHEWGCEGAADLDDLQPWAQINPAFGIRLDLATIADERAVMDDQTFSRERQGYGDQLVCTASSAPKPGRGARARTWSIVTAKWP